MLQSRQTMPRPAAPSAASSPEPSRPEVVDPIWLVKALAGSLLAAFLCAYLTLCLLFWQGQWQFVLHPSPSAPPAGCDAIHADPIRFDVDQSGAPQLTGCFLPATPGSRYADFTVLYLRDGDGSLRDSIAPIATLHDTGIAVLAFDYRGYGQSTSGHPTEQRMTEDAAAAWTFLTVSRHLKEQRVLPYGVGVGASLAVKLASNHPEIPALILEEPRGDFLDLALADPRGRFVPIRLLFHERFDLAAPLGSLITPKLLMSYPQPGQGSRPAVPAPFATAALPRITVDLPTAAPAEIDASLTRFLDQYLTASGVAPLVPR